MRAWPPGGSKPLALAGVARKGGGIPFMNNDLKAALTDIDEVLAFDPGVGGTAGVAAVCARMRACIDRRAPPGSIYQKMAEEVRPATDTRYNHEDTRLRAVVAALRHDLARGNVATSPLSNDTMWLAALGNSQSRQLTDNAELLRFIERGFELGREARVLALVAREASTSPWRPVFGRIDLVHPGDPSPLAIHPRGNVQVLEERPSVDVLVARLTSAFNGDDFIVGETPLANHGMNSPWFVDRGHQNGLDYGTQWPALLVAPSTVINNSPRVHGTIEADGPIPVFLGLERLAWAVSRFRESSGPGMDIRPRRFQLLAWDYRGRIDQFRVSGRTLFLRVTPPGNPDLRLVAVAHGRTAEAPLAKDAPGNEQLTLNEPIIRATVTLKHGADVIVEHALDLPSAYAIAELQGYRPRSPEFGEMPPGTTPTTRSAAAGDWTLGRHLGAGGQGIARLAYQTDPIPLVGVMKTIHAHPAGSTAQRTKALARFRREIEVTRSFEHPFILKVLDAQPDGDEPWVVTEYMPFGSLQQHLSVFRGDVWRSLRLARDLAVALDRLHAERLVHRDVKPSNILLRGLDHPVLGDFGIVHDAGEAQLTSTDEKVAPKWYGPPEAEDGRLDDPPPSFDVYSLGKVIYAMLSGGGRFQREDFRARNADLSTILDRPDLETVNSLLDRMVTLDSKQRFQSARDVVNAIDRALLELFGRRGADGRCRACGEAVREDRGVLMVDTGGLKAGGTPIQLHARVCAKCGTVELVDHAIAGSRS